MWKYVFFIIGLTSAACSTLQLPPSPIASYYEQNKSILKPLDLTVEQEKSLIQAMTVPTTFKALLNNTNASFDKSFLPKNHDPKIVSKELEKIKLKALKRIHDIVGYFADSNGTILKLGEGLASLRRRNIDTRSEIYGIVTFLFDLPLGGYENTRPLLTSLSATPLYKEVFPAIDLIAKQIRCSDPSSLKVVGEVIKRSQEDYNPFPDPLYLKLTQAFSK